MDKKKNKQQSIDKKIIFGFVLIFSVFNLLGFVSYKTIFGFVENGDMLSHAHNVIEETHAITSATRDAELEAKGYLVTGHKFYLDLCDSAFQNIDKHVQRLKKLTLGNSAQQKRISVLERLVLEKLNFIKTAIGLTNKGDVKAKDQMLSTSVIKEDTGAEVKLIDEIKKEEYLFLKKRITELENSAKNSFLVFTCLTVLGLALLYTIYNLIINDIKNRKLAMETLQESEKKLREYTSKLQRSNQELAQFAYIASHDLQEPLRMVASYCQLLQKRYSDKLDKDATEFINYAVDGATRMQRLIQDLLAYSRVETKGKEPQVVDCKIVLETVLSNLKAALQESKAVVTHDSLPTIKADPTQLGQLFQNLISNSLKFRSTDQPHVHISANKNGHDYHFSVHDNGIGIDPKFCDRIFEIFKRLHTIDEYPGTGIGLAICKKIVERHGGNIWVESEPGKGAAFNFTIKEMEAVTNEQN